MGEAAPDEPKSESAPPPAASEERPDWLVGAEDGVSAEFNRVEGATPRSAAPIKLSRPGADSGIESPGLNGEQVLRPAGPETPVAFTRPAGGESMLDLQGGDSSDAAPYVPPTGSESLRLPPGGPRAAAAATETTKAKPEKKAWAAAASSVPSLRVERRRIERKPDGSPRMDETEEDESAVSDFPDDNAPPALSVLPGGRSAAGSGAAARAMPVAPPRPVLKEAVWLVVMDDIRTNRRTQLLLGAAVLLVLVWTFFPRNTDAVSIAKLHAHPERYDGTSISVHGKVGEVFQVGVGYAYYLHQGRDTLVVFTNTSRPEPRQTVTVTGSITTGFLDGRPRQALFEGR